MRTAHRPFHSPLNRIQRSVFMKLTLILLVAAALVLFILVGFFRALWVESTEPPWKSHALAYVGYVVRDIGSPPDSLKIRQLSRDLKMEILVVSTDAAGSFQSGAFPVEALADEPDWQRQSGALRYGEWNREFLIGYQLGAYQYWFAPVDQKLFKPDWVRLFLLLLALLAVLAGIFIAIRRILRPVSVLVDGIRKISAGNLDVSFRSRSDEFGVISQTLTDLTTAVKERLKARDQLLLDVSHELRSPLTRMKVALELPDRSALVSSVSADIRELEGMITEILETERLRSPHGGLRKQSLRMDHLLSALALEAGPRVRFEQVESDRDPVLQADEERLRQVFRNLVENGLKYGRSDVVIRLTGQADGWMVTITDDGEGIRPEDLPYVFEPFYRADKSRTRSTGGFGLGLSLCQTIVTAHGGTIRVESEPGSTTFSVWLPVA
ncbi:MAG: HAMP domain-containing histidine kinase [Bacteroidetes bacterium]|nr:HAMP domain-containing histidine kinase [Bacteroidota bacterium]